MFLGVARGVSYVDLECQLYSRDFVFDVEKKASGINWLRAKSGSRRFDCLSNNRVW